MRAELPVSDSLMEEFSLIVARQAGLYFPRERWQDLFRAMVEIARDNPETESVADVISLMNNMSARDGAELLAKHLAVGETYFFREPALFDALEHEVLPPLIAARRNTGKYLRIWSAGCCTGEELYSLAILLERTIPDLPDWNLTLLGTDIHPRFLHRARLGVYRDWSFRNVPGWIRQRYFNPVGQGGHAVAAALRRMVTFDYLNLVADVYPGQESDAPPMDIVLCRNVLMYFEPVQAGQVIARMHDALACGGWLAVSSAEAGGQSFPQFERQRFADATLYRKRKPETAPRGITPVKPSSLRGAIRERSAQSLAEQARRYADSGLLDEASRLCNAAIDIDKCDPALRYLLALVLEEQGQLDAASEALNQALYLDPYFVLAHFALGNLCRRRRKDSEAARHFANAADLLHRHAPEDMLTASEGVSAGHLFDAMGLAGGRR